MSNGAHTATSDTRAQVLDAARGRRSFEQRRRRYDRRMPSALVQEIVDREGCSEEEAEFIAAIEVGLIGGDEFATDEHLDS